MLRSHGGSHQTEVSITGVGKEETSTFPHEILMFCNILVQWVLLIKEININAKSRYKEISGLKDWFVPTTISGAHMCDLLM